MERLVVAVSDLRTVVRCAHCGFLTARVHDRRRVRVHDLPHGGRPTVLVWIRRRFVCGNCDQRHTESHPEMWGRVTRRLARRMVRDAQDMSIKAVAARYQVSWWPTMRTVRVWSGEIEARRRRRRCRVLLVDETSLRRRHRYVTVISDGETGAVLGVVRHRDSAALGRFLQAQGPAWCRGVKVVVSDGSEAYRSAIRRWLPDARHVLDRFHVARWFAQGLIDVRRRIQRIGDVGSRPAFDPEIFRSRYLQQMRYDHLTDDQGGPPGQGAGPRTRAGAGLADAAAPLRDPPGFGRPGSQPGRRSVPRALPRTGTRRVPPHHRPAPGLGRRDLQLPHLRTHHQRPARRTHEQTRRPQTRRLHGFTNLPNFRARAILISPGVPS